MKHKIEALWRMCFNDTEEFIKLYFTYRYRDDITMSIEAEEQTIASLQMIPYPMTFGDRIIPTSYISGACTHPDFRNKGLMNELLRKSMQRMWEKGDLLTTLIPAEKWLFDYYGRFGYTTTFYYSTSFFSPENSTPDRGFSIGRIRSEDLQAYQYFDQKMLSVPYSIQHTWEDFNIILKDIWLSNGEVLIIRDNNEEIKGIVLGVPQEDKIIIKEIIVDGEIYKNALLTEIKTVFGNKPLEVIHFPDGQNIQELGMARIINAYQLLKIYTKKYPQLCFCFQLSDPIIKENNGYYHLENGECIQSDLPLKNNYREISISQLTTLVLMGKDQADSEETLPFPVHTPYMSLMLN